VRKFKLQVQVSLDGYMASPDGGMDWMAQPWTDDINAYVEKLTAPVDCIVLGRRLAEGFIPHWASQPEGESAEGSAKIHNTPKVVVSDTLTESPWDNTVVMGGDIAEIVHKLKAEPGGDLIAYGGGTLVASLITHNLLDEYHLFVNPTAIGAGMPVFPGRKPLRLITSRSFRCGVTALHFEPYR
jgi:dihydrofolate reductase